MPVARYASSSRAMVSSRDMTPTTSEDADVLVGGEMGVLMRTMDWAATPLGPVASWSPALRMMVRFLLANRFPLLLWWGPRYVSIYNDAYCPVLGTKHPWALGKPVSECWSEIWHILQPLIDTPFHGGPATWNDDILLEINRYGFVEETHFTIAYSPVPDETVPGGIGGVIATVHEITEKVVGERRVVVLRDLGARVGEAKTAEEACAIVAQTLAAHDRDVPFVLLYLIDPDGACARLAGAAGVGMGEQISPLMVDLHETQDLGWPLVKAMQTGTMQVVEHLEERFADVPPGPWSDPPNTAAVIPIPSNKAHEPAGVMVAGVSARLKLDEYYRDFLDLVRTQVATAITNARAYEEERRRAEALAALDQAKTAFFSNISHEFRTPLTLMLGPLEDALAQPNDLSAVDRERLTVAHRNALRLLRLVNTLLDFSRIEAGRLQASYEPTDLPGYTAELASTFRSALERAGLILTVDCPPLPTGAEAYVDREMWEKIVLNLLSNAFKFTFDGEITVALRAEGEALCLVVRDTGIGIAADELPRLFERFHRVEGTRSRTQEGTGIGLALVQELVGLHGGRIEVESTLGRGTAFTVTIPTGSAHLPADWIGAPRTQASTALGSLPFLDEALGWLDDEPAVPLPEPAPTAPSEPVAPLADPARPCILVADDNRDMRDYVVRLLRPVYRVQAVTDGEQALAAALADPPDLVLSDVMMPGLDGFGLVAALRADPRTREVPIILLSARAGEEARIEGVQAGADDYLVKPFAAKELLARIEGRLELARLRARAREQEVQARQAAEAATRARDEFLSIASHELRNPVAGIKGTAQLLQRMRRAGRLDDERLDRYLGAIEVGSNRLTTLTEDLLDVSRLQQGALPLRLRPTDLVALVRDVVARLPEQTRQRVRADLADGVQPITVDPDRVEQVVVNLLDNAAKYSVPQDAIDLSLEPDESGVLLRVRDRGIGLPAGVAEQIFQPFGRAANAQAANIPGLGLGLYICRRIAQQHGGTLRAESDGEGLGTTVLLRLPTVPPTGTAPHAG